MRHAEGVGLITNASLPTRLFGITAIPCCFLDESDLCVRAFVEGRPNVCLMCLRHESLPWSSRESHQEPSEDPGSGVHAVKVCAMASVNVWLMALRIQLSAIQ